MRAPMPKSVCTHTWRPPPCVNTHTRVHAHGLGGSLRPFHGSCCWARGTAPAFLQVPSGNSRAHAALIPDFKPFSHGHGVPLNRGDSLKGSGREGTLEAAPPNAPWHPALRESCRGWGDTPSTTPRQRHQGHVSSTRAEPASPCPCHTPGTSLGTSPGTAGRAHAPRCEASLISAWKVVMMSTSSPDETGEMKQVHACSTKGELQQSSWLGQGRRGAPSTTHTHGRAGTGMGTCGQRGRRGAGLPAQQQLPPKKARLPPPWPFPLAPSQHRAGAASCGVATRAPVASPAVL